MFTKTTAALLFAAALIAPSVSQANDMKQDQGGAGSSAGSVVQPAASNSSAGAVQPTDANPAAVEGLPQGGAGTSAGTLESGAAAQKLKGTIQSVDTQNGSFTIANEAGQAQTLTVPSTVQIKSKSSSKQLSWANLKAGQKVDVNRDASGAVTEIWLTDSKAKAK